MINGFVREYTVYADTRKKIVDDIEKHEIQSILIEIKCIY